MRGQFMLSNCGASSTSTCSDTGPGAILPKRHPPGGRTFEWGMRRLPLAKLRTAPHLYISDRPQSRRRRPASPGALRPSIVAADLPRRRGARRWRADNGERGRLSFFGGMP